LPLAQVGLPLCPPPLICPVRWRAPPTPDIYTLPLHDALPISCDEAADDRADNAEDRRKDPADNAVRKDFLARHYEPCDNANDKTDRKSTRLNSSHVKISYAVFCLKRKTRKRTPPVDIGYQFGD